MNYIEIKEIIKEINKRLGISIIINNSEIVFPYDYIEDNCLDSNSFFLNLIPVFYYMRPDSDRYSLSINDIKFIACDYP